MEAETSIVLGGWPGLRQLVLVGDPKQLPATVFSQLAKGCGYSISLFERLQEQGKQYSLLAVQYRMHPVISAWPREQFYGGALEDGPNVQQPGYGLPVQLAVAELLGCGSAGGLGGPPSYVFVDAAEVGQTGVTAGRHGPAVGFES